MSLAKHMQIIDAIQEIVMQDGNGAATGGSNAVITAEAYPWLSEEYIEIACNQEQIRNDFKIREQSLAYLSGIITDLYVDYSKLRYGGVDKRSKLPELQRLIYAADRTAINNFFINGK